MYFHILFIVHLNSTECDYGKRNWDCLGFIVLQMMDIFACWTVNNRKNKTTEPTNQLQPAMWGSILVFLQFSLQILEFELLANFKVPDLLCLWEIIHPAARLNYQYVSSRVSFKKNMHTHEHIGVSSSTTMSVALLSVQLILNKKLYHFLWAAEKKTDSIVLFQWGGRNWSKAAPLMGYSAWSEV